MASEQKKPDAGKESRSVLLVVAKSAIVLIAIGILGGLYLLLVHGPVSEAAAAMRVARYDIALSSLGNIPARFSDFPGVPLYRQKVVLGARTYRDAPEWDSIGEDLKGLRAAHPDDADLMVIEARYWTHMGDYGKAGTLAEQAIKEDGRNSEAWFLLGLQREHAGDMPKALENYRKAVDASPESPLYRSSLAHALLETGKPDEALAESGRVRDFPRARIEEALARWAKGQMKEAAAAQREAWTMLENESLTARYHNRREWLFYLTGGKPVRMAASEDKLCYARLGEAVSRSLAGEPRVAFPPQGCEKPPQEVRELLAAQLCRFVEKPQPAMGEAARRLRGSLGVSGSC